MRVLLLPMRRPKNLVDGRPALSVTTFCARNRARQAAPLPNRILRSALRFPREGKDHAGASLLRNSRPRRHVSGVMEGAPRLQALNRKSSLCPVLRLGQHCLFIPMGSAAGWFGLRMTLFCRIWYKIRFFVDFVADDDQAGADRSAGPSASSHGSPRQAGRGRRSQGSAEGVKYGRMPSRIFERHREA